jgi:hypothetical protein
MFEGGVTHPASDPKRVAVAVTTVSPVGSGKLKGPKVALQFALVVTTLEPRKCFPCPNPDEWHAGLEKNSRRKLVLATLSKVPETMTLPPPDEAEVITG